MGFRNVDEKRSGVVYDPKAVLAAALAPAIEAVAVLAPKATFTFDDDYDDDDTPLVSLHGVPTLDLTSFNDDDDDAAAAGDENEICEYYI